MMWVSGEGKTELGEKGRMGSLLKQVSVRIVGRSGTKGFCARLV